MRLLTIDLVVGRTRSVPDPTIAGSGAGSEAGASCASSAVEGAPPTMERATLNNSLSAAEVGCIASIGIMPKPERRILAEDGGLIRLRSVVDTVTVVGNRLLGPRWLAKGSCVPRELGVPGLLLGWSGSRFALE